MCTAQNVCAAQIEGVSEGRSCTGASAAKREVRVLARGRSSSHATIRSILIAAAIATKKPVNWPTQDLAEPSVLWMRRLSHALSEGAAPDVALGVDAGLEAPMLAESTADEEK